MRAFAKVDGVEYPLVGDVYSAEADSLQGTLYYDSLSEEKGLTKNQERDRFESFRDKIVLTWESKGVFVRRAMEAGAKAVLHICATKGDYIHHSNIGMIWGTPDFDEAAYMKFLPSAGIRRADGDPFGVCESALCTSVGIKAWSTDRMVVRSFRWKILRIYMVL